ncbi:MAG: hypothetical protein ABI552_14035 [Casimicrobiaceae bacterium]
MQFSDGEVGGRCRLTIGRGEYQARGEGAIETRKANDDGNAVDGRPAVHTQSIEHVVIKRCTV